MLLTPQHRRSTRISCNALSFEPKQGKVDKREEITLKNKLNESVKCSDMKKNEGIHDDAHTECPHVKDFEYDKEMYLANDRYADMIDTEISQLLITP